MKATKKFRAPRTVRWLPKGQTDEEWRQNRFPRLPPTLPVIARNSNLALSVEYTYENDLLTTLETASTSYNFIYGDFALKSNTKVGSRTLVSYSYYENDRTYRLKQLTYGNNDSITYTYDQQGRVTRETYEDGAFVTYDYDNSGALATVYDSESGISKTYYYDFTDRMMKYVESGDNYSLSVGYEYDEINNLSSMVETINGVAHTTSYTYDDDNRVTSITTDGTTEVYTYDGFGRVSQKVTKNGKTTILTETYTYTTNANGNPTGQIATLHTQAGGYNVTYSYTYDDNGNILSIYDGTNTTTYEYDSANQLIRENDERAGVTRTWTYDDAGNILTEKTYPYTLGTLSTAADTVSYNYDDTTAWGDLLIAYDGTAITYDTIGNPLTDGTWSYTWKHGRQLASMTDGASTWTYSYNVDGLRTSRTNGTTAYNYIYSGSQLAQMTVDGNTLYFTYDASGTPQTITLNGATYYYATNIQGDIVAILDSTGTAVVTYSYDAWGAHLSGTNGTGSDASTLGRYNPLRYRGYVFDAEAGLYYVSSRYYDPEIGRWINVDNVVSGVSGSLQGYNMFLYCFNNPANMSDHSGQWPKWAKSIVKGVKNVVKGVKATAKWVNKKVIQPVLGLPKAAIQVGKNVVEDVRNFKLSNSSEDAVFSSNYLSGYKGAVVIKTPFDASFSFGIIGLSKQQQNSTALNHEYGHFVQLQNMGLFDYTENVAIPSITINILDRFDKLQYAYYGAPWEAEADMLGGVNRTQDNTPWPEDAYNSYSDLIIMFFK